jgi:predicted lipoprotein with Yx(FWY)xxD motif
MVLMLCTGAAGAGLAVLVGVAVAQSFTLNVAKTATVTNANTQQSKVEAIAVRKGFAVYMLSGDSKSHPKCRVDNGCFGVWPPVKLSSAKNLSKAAGIKGKLGTWKRNGFIQLTLGGHPLYRYGGDGNRKNIATGEAINSFRGIWHVVLGAAGGSGGTTTTVTTGTTPTTTYTYPTTTYTYPMP